MTTTMVDDGHDRRGCGYEWDGECTWLVTLPPSAPIPHTRARRSWHRCQWDRPHRGPCTCRRCGATTEGDR